MKKVLPNVTLLGIDCVDVSRLERAMEICMKDFEFGAVKLLTHLETQSPYKVTIEPISSIEEYSKFIIEKLDTYVETDFVLIVQYDGFILNFTAWNDDFLNYDYIGAPWLVADWSVKNFGFPEEWLGMLVVGNGGFSLRSKKFLSLSAQLAREGMFPTYHPEDVVLCVHHRKILEDRGVRFAPVELAKQFSFEYKTDTNVAWTNEFGFHGFKWTDITQWLEKHPEFRLDNPKKRIWTIEELKQKLSTEGFPIVYEWTDAPGTIYEEHMHQGRVSMYVTRGSVIFSGGINRTVSPGERIDVPVGVKHSACVGPEGCEYVVGQEIEGDA